jgi:hypothetical protein
MGYRRDAQQKLMGLWNNRDHSAVCVSCDSIDVRLLRQLNNHPDLRETLDLEKDKSKN